MLASLQVLRRCARLTCTLLVATLAAASAHAQPPARPALRIVVIEGEDAVNIIQQRTAVAPIVEVRDRNDQPVAGAVVRFAIRAGRGSFNGSRTLALSTNAAGRATALGLAPDGAGTLQIAATASFQGQTAAITITQTNVATAAQAAALGSGTSGGGAAGGGAAGGSGAGASAGGAAAGGAAGAGAVAGGTGAAAGTAAGAGAATAGGLSTTTLVIAGAAAAGGAYGIKTAVDKVAAAKADLTGTYAYRYDRIFRNNQTGAVDCGYTVEDRGTATLSPQSSTSTIPADFSMDGTETIVASTCGLGGPTIGQGNNWGITMVVTGSSAGFSGSISRTWTFSGGTGTEDMTVSGTTSGTSATVTFTKSDVIAAIDTGRGSGTTSITLQ